MEIILASNSPRRKEILKNAGIEFKVEVSNSKEIYSHLFDEKNIKKNSLYKVLAHKDKDALIIGADTVVILDSVCLVKPQNFFEAFLSLKKLSNKTHKVVTSHTLMYQNRAITNISTSYVTFRKLGTLEIINYILKKKPYDKAGSYGIQDFLTAENASNPPSSSFIQKLEGSYYNVMGLDIELVLQMIALFPCL